MEGKMTEASKEDLLAFLDKIDAVADEMENHPQLMVYYIGIVDQIRNSNTAARTNLNSS
jgi:uncharacterized protein Yka (UPF0111/DUF47 family)